MAGYTDIVRVYRLGRQCQNDLQRQGHRITKTTASSLEEGEIEEERQGNSCSGQER